MRNNYNQRKKIPFTQRIVDFMYGRNGFDQLGRFVLILYLVFAVVNIFLNSIIIMAVETLLMIYSVFRFMSKNIYKRRSENEKYCRFENKITGFFKLQRNKWRDRKTHVYRKCPHCKKTLRLPRRKGEHTVNCPVCHNRFDIKI